jgi:hypothetical protein
MNTNLIAGLITILLGAAPTFAADNGALLSLAGSHDLAAAAEAVPQASAFRAVGAGSEKGAQPWTAEVKKAYKQQLESGKLFSLPTVKNSELPAAALKQLNKDNQGQSAKVASAYKLTVKNQPAFVVHNRRDGKSLAAHIFEAKGKLVAVAKAASSQPLYWEDLPSYSSGSGGSSYGPDDIWDGTSGQGSNYGGPDSDYDGGGCGGSGGYSDGSGPDDVGGNGI